MVMLPEWTSLGVFVAAALLLLITPGPAVLYIVARSVDQGPRAGLVSAAGVHAGTLVHVAAAAAGVSVILAASATLFSLVKYLGAAYLIHLGIRRLLDRATVSPPGETPAIPLRRAFVDGAVVNVLNPKTALFFLAFLPQFVDPARGAGGPQVLALGLVFVMLGLCTDGLYAVAAGSVRQWVRASPRFMDGQRWVTGGMYIGLGVLAAISDSRRK
jgi:threonine/homoserine/homoserine lactone efflux protein